MKLSNPISRRHFLKNSALYGAGAITLTNLAFYPGSVLADWPSKAYSLKSVDDVIGNLFGSEKVTDSSDIRIKVPTIAENGAVVPVSVKSKLPNIEAISILVDKNPNPLVANFSMVANQKGHINTRIKMGKTSNVIAVVKAEGKLYKATQLVKVTIGGCGG